MAPQAPQRRHTSVIELASDFSDGGSEYWPGESGYVFKPNDDYYHRSLASQWMESIGESRKGTSAVFVSTSTLSYHITSIKRCSKICFNKSIAFPIFMDPKGVLCTVPSVVQSTADSLPRLNTNLGQSLAPPPPTAYSSYFMSTPSCNKKTYFFVA